MNYVKGIMTHIPNKFWKDVLLSFRHLGMISNIKLLAGGLIPVLQGPYLTLIFRLITAVDVEIYSQSTPCLTLYYADMPYHTLHLADSNIYEIVKEAKSWPRKIVFKWSRIWCNVLVMLRAVLSTNSTIKNTIYFFPQD